MMWAGLLARFWPHIAGGLAIIAVLVGAYQTGVNAERSRGEAAWLRVQIETLRRDKAITDRALERAAKDTAELEALRRTDEEKIDQLQEVIRAAGRDGLSQSELDGLLNIR